MSLEKQLLDYFELGKILREEHDVSMSEYNMMLPWHLDVELSLIRRDQEEKKQKLQHNAF